jgi:hypothetical protein
LPGSCTSYCTISALNLASRSLSRHL